MSKSLQNDNNLENWLIKSQIGLLVFLFQKEATEIEIKRINWLFSHSRYVVHTAKHCIIYTSVRKNIYNTYKERETSVRERLPDCSDYESDDEDEGLVWEKRA